MSKEYEIGMLWVEGPLSYVEVLCAQSFLDAGHHVKLYHYKDVKNVPEGVELVHGDNVLKIDSFIQHGRTGSFALFSDVFRYQLLNQNDDIIWADLDAYCVKPFKTETGHFFGWESEKRINGGVLGLPSDSDALGLLIEMTKNEYGIPEWYPDDIKVKFQERMDAGNPVHVSEMRWGTWGPSAVTFYLQKTGEDKYAFPIEGLYPISFKHRRYLMRTKMRPRVEKELTENTYSIHFFGRRVREILADQGGLPEPESYMDMLLKKHNVDTDAAPVLSRAQEAADKIKKKSAKKNGRAVPINVLPNLTDLADKYGSDKGSTKHRYTELYHMLFNPYRKRKISFLEMGLLIGGPEHGVDADRRTTDAPSIRMWLEYFPKAHIHGLDVSDFSWFEHERFTFHRCDMDERENISDVMKKIDPFPQIVIDDASHASHHQQSAFLEIFPRMESGGLYIIEDLRWQPKAYERRGVTKTAALFRSWLNNREFEHTDPVVAAEFNALRDSISGCIVEPAKYRAGWRDQIAVIHKK